MRNLCLAVPLLAACAEPEIGKSSPLTLRISGSHTLMDRLIPQLSEAHSRSIGNTQFSLSRTNNAEGIKNLLNGSADLAASTREPTYAEQRQAKANGYSLNSSEHIIGVDVLAVATHGANPLSSLTYDQVIGIFCTEAIDNWSYLGQEDQAIRVLVRPPSSGSRALFEDFFCGPKGFHRQVEVAEAKTIAEVLNTDETAVSFISLSQRAGKPMALRPETQAKPVVPSKKNIIRGAYPLAQDLVLYSAGAPKGEVSEFLNWIESPAGQDVVDEADFVPLFLRPEMMNEPRPLRETVHFETSSSRPTARSIARIGLLIDELKERVGEHNHIVLEGYTDALEKNQMELSHQRAQTVKDILSEALPDRFFEIIPRGKVLPIAPNETPYGRQRNRRVQIYLADEERNEAGENEQPSTEP